MPVAIEYTLEGRGWALLTLSIDEATVTLQASYFSDALDDLLRATTAAVLGQIEQTATLTDEPGEYRLKLRPIGETLAGQGPVGAQGYRELWGNLDFPSEPLERLRAALKSG